MLQIILLILKIIGIVLLSILALIILLTALLLFVPVRYRALLKKKEDISADAKISWLLHIVSARIRYADGSNKMALYVFGIKIYDNSKPKKEKKVRNKKSRHRKSKHSKRRGTKSGQKPNQILIEDRSEPKDDADVSDTSEDSKSFDLTIADNSDFKTVYDTETTDLNGISDDTETSDDRQKIFYGTEADTEKKKNIFRKIKEAVLSFINKFRSMINSVTGLFREIKRKKDVIFDFLRDPTNKSGFEAVWSQTKKLLKVIMPKKILGRICFGTGDPCTTGQLLGLISMFYGVVMPKVKLQPDFENKIFEADLKIKGHIMMITLLRIVIRVLRDKNFKYLRNSFSSLKEDVTKPAAA